MGFLDNIIKDIASGEIDKRLENLADGLERISGTLEKSADTLAKKPENLVTKINKTEASVSKAIKVKFDDDSELAA